MTNAKVKVSKEVAKAIEVLRSEGNTNEKILRVLASSIYSWVGPKSSVLNTTPFDTVAKALYVGYEVEKSPEEELASIYKYYKFEAYTTDMTAYADGIERAITTLGLKIEGVNA